MQGDRSNGIPWHRLWVGWVARPNHLPPDRQAMTEEPAIIADRKGWRMPRSMRTKVRNEGRRHTHGLTLRRIIEVKVRYASDRSVF